VYTNTNVVYALDVVRQETDDSSIPSKLRTVQPIPESSSMRTREWRFERGNGLWQINGKIWTKTVLMQIQLWVMSRFGVCITTRVDGSIQFIFT
jgi:hypothetical protein